MSLELNALKFTVDTSAFDQAIKKIDQLTTAVGEVTSKGKSQKISVDTKDFDSGISKAKKFGDAIEEINRSQRSLKLSADIQEFDSAFTRVSQSVKALERPLKSLKLSIDTKDFDSGISKVNKALSALSKPLKAIDLRVDSKGLDDAIKKVADLKVSLEGVNKAIQANVVVNAQAQKAQADMAIAAEKVKKAQAETLIVEEKLVAAKARSENAQVRLNKVDQESVTILQRQQYIREFMTQGFTRGQSSILAYAKAAKTAESDMQALMTTLKSQRALIGGDPFDKSLSAIEGMRNEFKLLRAAQREYGSENSLTIKQLRDLALEKERVLERMKIERASFSDIKAAIRSTTQEYRALAGASGEVAGKLKSKDQAVKDTAKANKFLEDQLFQVDYRLKEVDKTLSTGTVNALRRFETAVRKSGKPLEEQTRLINQYRASLMSLQKDSGNRAADTISRALGPQITDIVVGLATGQSLYMVALQQGGQLRDQMALAGIEANKMGQAMRTAAKDMVTSVASVTVAFGQLFTGMIVDGGRAITSLFGKGVKSIGEWAAGLRGGAAQVAIFNKTLEANETHLAKITNWFIKSTSAAAAFGLAAVSAVAVLGALAVATVKVIRQGEDLSRDLALQSAYLGLNKNSAYGLVQGYKALGLSSVAVSEALMQIAKTGDLSKDALDRTIRLAAELKDKVGIPVEETIKKMVEIGEGPTAALLKYSKQMSGIPPEIIQVVYELERVGNKTEAARVAQDAFAAAAQGAGEKIVDSLHPVTEAIVGITKLAKGMWEAIYGATLPEGKKSLLEQYNNLYSDIQRNFQGTVPGSARDTLKQQKLVELRLLAERIRLEEIAAGKEAANEARVALMRQDQAAYDKARDASQKELEKRMTREEFIQSRLKKIYGEKLEMAKQDALLSQRVAAIQAEAGREYDQMKAKSPEARDAKKEQESLEKYYARITNAAKDYTIEATKASNEASEAMRKYLEVANDPQFAKLTEQQQNSVKAYYESVDALKEFDKATQIFLEDQKKLEAARQEQKLESEKRTLDLQTERMELEKRKALMSATPEEQAKITAEYEKQKNLAELLRKEQEELFKIAKDERFRNSEEDRKKAEQAVIDYYKEKRILAEAEAAQKMQEFYQQRINEITSGISDAVVTALFEGGKAGSRKLRDLLIAELKKPITIYVNAVVNSLIGGTVDAILGKSSENGGGISGILSTGKQLFELFSKGVGAIGWSQMEFLGKGLAKAGEFTGWTGLQEFGSGVQAGGITQGTTTAAPGSSGAFSNGVNFSKIGASAIGAFVGNFLNKKISNGFSTSQGEGEFNKYWKVLSPFSNSVIQDLAVAIGSAVNPVLGAIIGGAAGLFNRAFGRKLTKAGIEGNFSGTGFSGNRFEFHKGGWFRSDKTKRSALDSDTKTFLGDTFGLLKASMQDLAAYFGSGLEGVTNFSRSIKVNLKGKSDKEVQNIFEGIFNSMRESMAGIILAGTSYRLENESGIKALERLKTSMDAVNTVLFMLGDESLKVSLATADASYQLGQLFGGIDKFQERLGSYYDKFFTEEEKLQRSMETLVIVMTALGTGIPATREEFRRLVNAQDLTTEAGRQTFKSLIDISDTFWQVTESTEQARKKFEEFGKSLVEYVNQLTIKEGASSQNFDYAKVLFADQLNLAKLGDETAQGSLTSYADNLINLAKESASSALEYEKILAAVKSELLGLASGTGVTTALTSTGPVAQASASSAQTVQQQNLNMQSLLQSILDKLSEMSASDRAEAVAVVTKISDIAKVVTRADNGDSINVAIVT